MYKVFVKNHKPKKKDEYKEVMKKRIFFVKSRIKKEQEEKTKFKYF